jgi:hypothetical protein
MENKNYIGSLVRLQTPETEEFEVYDVLYIVFGQEDDKLILQRVDTNKEMKLPIKWLDSYNNYFKVVE